MRKREGSPFKATRDAGRWAGSEGLMLCRPHHKIREKALSRSGRRAGPGRRRPTWACDHVRPDSGTSASLKDEKDRKHETQPRPPNHRDCSSGRPRRRRGGDGACAARQPTPRPALPPGSPPRTAVRREVRAARSCARPPARRSTPPSARGRARPRRSRSRSKERSTTPTRRRSSGGSCNTADGVIELKDIANVSIIGVGGGATFDQLGIHIRGSEQHHHPERHGAKREEVRLADLQRR